MFRSPSDTTPRDLNDFISRLAYVAELKEWDNRSHIERMRKYCQIITVCLDISPTEARLISLASQLHDVGKITIPEILLQKPGNYEASEWDVVERHTIEGAIILNGSSSPVLQTAETIAYTHHERWDGSGYPQGLKGDEIPLSGRICAIADVFDALTSKRTYKAAITEAEALQLIQTSAGTMFDPKVVKVFSEKFNDIQKIRRMNGS